MQCSHCWDKTLPGDQPQPGWGGLNYKPGRDIVFLLQNPAVAPKNYGSQREALIQKKLRDFTANPSLESYDQLMSSVFEDMTGSGKNPPWPKWVHPIGKIVQDPSRIAWMNVAKYRTCKNGYPRKEAFRHGIEEHLGSELKLLRPKVVVSVGNGARIALELLGLSMESDHLKLQGASNAEVRDLRKRLLDKGMDASLLKAERAEDEIPFA
jgi:hypothetical protein